MLPSQLVRICMADLGTDGVDETADLGKDDDDDAVANAMGQEHDASVFGS